MFSSDNQDYTPIITDFIKQKHGVIVENIVIIWSSDTMKTLTVDCFVIKNNETQRLNYTIEYEEILNFFW